MVETSLWGAMLGETCDTGGEQYWGWFVYPFVMLYAFYILAQLCDGHLTRALEYIVERIKMSEDVAGATFLAMASSAPELFTSIIATFVVESASGVGNILGSAVFNLLVIIGVVPIFAGNTLKIWWYPTARDSVFYFIAIAEIFLVLIDGKVYWWEGFIMTFSYFLYAAFFTQNARVVEYLGLKVPDSGPSSAAPVIKMVTPEETEDAIVPAKGAGTGGTSSEDVAAAAEVETAPVPRRSDVKHPTDKSGHSDGSAGRSGSKNAFTLRGREGSKSSNGHQVGHGHGDKHHGHSDKHKSSQVVPVVPSEPDRPSAEKVPADTWVKPKPEEEEAEEEPGYCRYEPIMMLVDKVMPESPDWLYTLFVLCCLWIGLFTYFAVDSSMRLGCLVNMPDIVMGLIFLAAGTSVPDAMGSIAVAKDGMGDMAVANAVGSNTFDILLGLGLPWFLKGLISQKPIVFSDDGTLVMAICMLTVCLVIYLIMITANRWRLTRRLGMMLLFLYSAVICWFLVYYYWVREAT